MVMEQQHKLLIVDDDEDTRQIYRDFFTNQGFIVDTATDGVDGLEKLLPNEFDVAIVDIKMPKMDGIEMIHQALIDDRVDASMIILTGHGDRKEVVKAINYGADAWFDKLNIDMSELLKRTQELAQVVPPDAGRRLSAILRQAEQRA
jgi:DNA-binding response OmpR family regulator